MGGSESLFDGVSGLSEHQTWMDVIGNNIANVNTSGFKTDQFNFEDQLSQELQGASAAVNGGLGGTDFEQVGLGTHVGSILSNQQQGSLQTTNLPTDFAIQGDGFFIVNNGQANFYTRDSNFIVDGFGNINMAANGMHLQGYGIKQVGNTVTLDNTKVVNLTVPQQINPAQETNLLDLIGNLQSSATTPQTQSIGVYDSLGQLHNVVLTFSPSGKADGNWTVSATGADLTPGSLINVSGGNAASSVAGSAGLHFNALGQLDGTITPLVLSFLAGGANSITNPPAGGTPVQGNPNPDPTQAAQPWLIPGSQVPSNAAQSAVILNLNDPLVGNLTQFASQTVTSVQAAPNTQVIPNPSNAKVAITGNLTNVAPAAGFSNMGAFTFVAQDSTGATHTFQVGQTTTDGLTFNPQLLTVDGYSGAAAGTLQNNAAAPALVDATVQGFDSTGQQHSFQIELSPNAANSAAGIDEGTIWGAYVVGVDGNGSIPVTGAVQEELSATSTPANFNLNFNKVEPDGTNHQFQVTFSVDPGTTTAGAAGTTTYEVSSVTVDGVTNANVTTVPAVGSDAITVDNATGAVTGTLEVDVAANTFGNAVAESGAGTGGVVYDFSTTTGSAASTDVNPSVEGPTAAMKYKLNTITNQFDLISGGAINIAVNQNSLFEPGSAPSVATGASTEELNAAQLLSWDFAQLQNVGTAPATPNGNLAGVNVVTLPASLTSAGTMTFNGGGNDIATLTIPAGGFGNNNALETLTLDFGQVKNTVDPTGLTGPLAGSPGNSAGSLKDFNVDQTGVLHGVYTNGFTQEIGQILLATFENPGGLEHVGTNLLQISSDSGVVNVGTPGTGKTGTIAEGNIETSNVDLAQEFSNMILAERGFQANSRIITTSDTMLEQLVNLKQSA